MFISMLCRIDLTSPNDQTGGTYLGWRNHHDLLEVVQTHLGASLVCIYYTKRSQKGKYATANAPRGDGQFKKNEFLWCFGIAGRRELSLSKAKQLSVLFRTSFFLIVL